MEPGEPTSAILSELRQAYRDGFAAPPDASARVLRSVARSDAHETPRFASGSGRRRTPMAVVLAVPLLAAAALSWVWCAPEGAQRFVADEHADAAAYQGDDRAVSGAISPRPSGARVDRTAGPGDGTHDAISPAVVVAPAELEAVPRIDPPTPRRSSREPSFVPPHGPTDADLSPRSRPTTAPTSDEGVVDIGGEGPQIEGLVVALQGVERNLRQDRPDLALATLAKLREALQATDLREEHDALRLLALCRSRPVATTAELRTRFADAFPGSLYADRIAQTCNAAAVESIPGTPQ